MIAIWTDGSVYIRFQPAADLLAAISAACTEIAANYAEEPKQQEGAQK